MEVIDIEETDEAVDLVERVCALDIGKAALTVCIRVPHDDKPGHRRQEVREHATTTRSLLDLAARLHAARACFRSHSHSLMAAMCTVAR